MWSDACSKCNGEGMLRLTVGGEVPSARSDLRDRDPKSPEYTLCDQCQGKLESPRWVKLIEARLPLDPLPAGAQFGDFGRVVGIQSEHDESDLYIVECRANAVDLKWRHAIARVHLQPIDWRVIPKASRWTRTDIP